jgi:hypothetical protein
MANWWDAYVGSGGGSPSRPAPDQKRYNAIQDEGDQARGMIRNLLRARQLVDMQPTGVIPGALAGIKRLFGDDSMTTQAREQLDALNNRMVMSYRQPGTGAISDAERASFRGSLANPNYQRASNQRILGDDLASQAASLAKAKLAATWRSRVGSLDQKAPNGSTFDQALGTMVKSDSYRRLLQQARGALIPGGVPAYNAPQEPDPNDGWKVVR